MAKISGQDDGLEARTRHLDFVVLILFLLVGGLLFAVYLSSQSNEIENVKPTDAPGVTYSMLLVPGIHLSRSRRCYNETPHPVEILNPRLEVLN